MAEELKPELVFYTGSRLLEGPIWDEVNQLLYFFSIEDNMIYCLNEETTEVVSYPTESVVGAAVLTEDGKLLSAELDGIYAIDLETKEREFVMQPNTDERLRYNDGKLDPEGRFLVGTMGLEDDIEGGASLYQIEDGEARELLLGLTTSNGLDWSKDGKTFYHIDTPTDTVMKYDYDMETGNVSNGRVAVEITDEESGFPDGMCVDVDGNIWVAEFTGKRICKWNVETGEQLVEIPMPVSNVSSCCIGGKEMDTLYITTAQEDGEPLSGGLFKVKIR